MKSKLGQTKISPNAKASTLVNYTKHQEKAQNRKVIYSFSSFVFNNLKALEFEFFYMQHQIQY